MSGVDEYTPDAWRVIDDDGRQHGVHGWRVQAENQARALAERCPGAVYHVTAVVRSFTSHVAVTERTMGVVTIGLPKPVDAVA